MKSDTTRYMVYGQLSFLISVLICIFLLPKGLSSNAGISYYGIYTKTLLPYAAGLLAVAYFSFKAARAVPTAPLYRPIKLGLYSFAPLAIAILLTPYNYNRFLDWTHTAFGIVFFSIELLMSIWLVLMLRWDRFNAVLLIMLGLEGMASALYLKPTAGLLLQSQILFQITFTAIFLRTINLKTESI